MKRNREIKIWIGQMITGLMIFVVSLVLIPLLHSINVGFGAISMVVAFIGLLMIFSQKSFYKNDTYFVINN